MVPNRRDLESALSTVTSELLKEKGFLCFVDIFMRLGYLSQSDYEHWRFRRVPHLERVLTLHLSTLNFLMKAVRRNSLHGHLQPSMTVYTSWGKHKKTLLQFSTSGDPTIETAYATHFWFCDGTLITPLQMYQRSHFAGGEATLQIIIS